MVHSLPIPPVIEGTSGINDPCSAFKIFRLYFLFFIFVCFLWVLLCWYWAFGSVIVMSKNALRRLLRNPWAFTSDLASLKQLPCNSSPFNSLSANFTNGQIHSNNSSANCLSVFDHLMGLVLFLLSHHRLLLAFQQYCLLVHYELKYSRVE